MSETLSKHKRRIFPTIVDNELQPNVNQNVRLDINSGLYDQPSVRRGRRDHLQSATLKRDTTKNI